MDSQIYINGQETVKMSLAEFESKIAKATEEGYHSGRKAADKVIEEIKGKLRDAEKDNILLQVRHDQMLKAIKEIALCLQYVNGNGYIK